MNTRSRKWRKKQTMTLRSRNEPALDSGAASGFRHRFAIKAVIGVAAAMLGLGAIAGADKPTGGATQDKAPESDAAAGRFAFQVGKPGPGTKAPDIRLASTAGGTFDLAAWRGKRVLLFFHEGLMCQPCWEQTRDIERNMQRFRDLGVDAVVSVTTDQLDDLKQKVAYERLATPVLSDPYFTVSRAYDANSYGMMGKSRDGHSFILVGEGGTILWRADYGGAPKYFM
ncbi:MAG TPA: peroxiredoxin family protein, partial [Casimicrobiaceae bacterium]